MNKGSQCSVISEISVKKTANNRKLSVTSAEYFHEFGKIGRILNIQLGDKDVLRDCDELDKCVHPLVCFRLLNFAESGAWLNGDWFHRHTDIVLFLLLVVGLYQCGEDCSFLRC